MSNGEMETTEIVISGGGPVGSILSVYLGQMNIDNVVLEREVEIPPYPRAFSLGEDGIRVFQGAGLYPSLFTEIGQPPTIAHFQGGTEADLYKRPFIRMNLEKTYYSGHPKSIMFKQPRLEESLRRRIMDLPSSDFRTGCTVSGITEDNDWVYVHYLDQQKQEKIVKCRLLVGTDGKTGYVRKNYLEPKGVIMEKTHRYEEQWMSINFLITPATPESHPDFPLWKLGYTADQVYDLFIPKEFQVYLQPQPQRSMLPNRCHDRESSSLEVRARYQAR